MANKLKKITKQVIKSCAIMGFLLIFLAGSTIPALAAETDVTSNAPVYGPQEPVGSQGAIGPQGDVGVTQPTGPQEPTGPQPTTQEVTIDTASDKTTVNVEPSQDTNNVETPNINNTGSADTHAQLSNIANTDNNISVGLDTGNNNIGESSVVGNISTGDITSAVNLINVSNSQFAPGSSVGSQLLDPSCSQIVLVPSANRTMLENSNTGPYSDNLNTLNNPNVIEVFDLNNANIDNGIVIDANTGKNTLSSSTKAGDLTTGDINLGVNLINIANLLMPDTLLSLDIFNLPDSYNGDLVIPELANVSTGSNSSNQNLLTESNKTGVQITQNGDVDNLFNINTNTGKNEAKENTLIGSITSGANAVKTGVTNLINAASVPIVYLINVFGKWTGALDGLNPDNIIVNEINDTTGPDSTNINQADLNNSSNLTVENQASVNNKITIDADTGHNKVLNNTVAGDIKTGAVNVTANIVNVLNSLSNKIGKFSLRIVNIFGDWNGNATATIKTKDQNNSNLATGSSESIATNATVTQNGVNFTSNTSVQSAKKFSNKTVLGVSQSSNLNDPSSGSNISGLGSTGNSNTSTPITKTRAVSEKIMLIISLAVAFGLIWLLLEILAMRKPKINPREGVM